MILLILLSRSSSSLIQASLISGGGQEIAVGVDVRNRGFVVSAELELKLHLSAIGASADTYIWSELQSRPIAQ